MYFEKCLVSVIIPTYGRCDYLVRTINSVLNQTYLNVEVIVVDDNGKNTEQGIQTNRKMEKFVDHPAVKYIQHHINQNGSVARNTGFAASRGEFIAYLDDDDEFRPEKIEIQVKELLSNPQYAAVYCFNSKYYNGKILQTTSYDKSGDCQYDILCITSDIHTSSLLIRKNVIADMKGWDEEYKRHQDYEFLIRFFENNIIKCIPKSLLSVHVESEINRPNVDKLIAAKKIYFHKLDQIISKYTRDEIRVIRKAHNLEIFRVCFKNMDLRLFKYLIKSKPSFRDIKIYILPVAIRTLKKILPSIKNY